MGKKKRQNRITRKTNDNMPSTAQTIAGVLGNVLEWYDFALFGYFSDIIGQVFFPPSSTGGSNLIQSFAVFGGAFLMRPIGGLAIGYIGDKYGRKLALTVSLFLMAFPTFLMGLLPTYDAVGRLAIVLLAVLRLLQGMSVGGQLPASLVYTVEHHDPSTWGFYGSLVMVAANVGTLLGNIVGATMRSVLTEEELVAWGWRIPFLSGILIGIVGLYLKVYGEEIHSTPGGEAGHNPIKEAFALKNCSSLSSAALAPTLWAGGFYVTFVWMAIYMETLLEPPVPNAFWVNACSMFFGSTCMLPIFGHLSDLIGRLKTMYTGAILSAITGPIFLLIIGATKNPFISFLCQTAIGITISMFAGPMCAWIVEIFPRRIRLTSASLGYDFAHATSGGFSPLMATLLFSQGKFAPGLLYPIFSILSLTGITLMQFSKANQASPDGLEMEQRNSANDNNDDLELFPTEETEGEQKEIRAIT